MHTSDGTCCLSFIYLFSLSLISSSQLIDPEKKYMRKNLREREINTHTHTQLPLSEFLTLKKKSFNRVLFPWQEKNEETIILMCFSFHRQRPEEFFSDLIKRVLTCQSRIFPQCQFYFVQ